MRPSTRTFLTVLAPPLAVVLLFVAGPLVRRHAASTETAAIPSAIPSAMARYDRPALSLDLSDSTLYILVRGIRVRTVRPSRFRMSGPTAQDYFAGQLFTLQTANGTAQRVSIRPIQAPADTAEFRKQRPPAPVSTAPFYATLRYERGVTMYLDPDSAGFAARSKGLLYRGIERVTESVALWRGGAPAEHWFSIRLHPADLRAIYRALEDGSPLALTGD